MSRSELHDWECAIEKLSGDNADKMLAIAQDIYNTAFVRGKNYISLVQQPCEDCISRQAVFELIDFYDGQNQQHFTVDNLRDDVKNVLPVIPKGVTVTDFADKCRECGREKVLDKIKEEIRELATFDTVDVLVEVSKIIDKYKAESEE